MLKKEMLYQLMVKINKDYPLWNSIIKLGRDAHRKSLNMSPKRICTNCMGVAAMNAHSSTEANTDICNDLLKIVYLS